MTYNIQIIKNSIVQKDNKLHGKMLIIMVLFILYNNLLYSYSISFKRPKQVKEHLRPEIITGNEEIWIDYIL